LRTLLPSVFFGAAVPLAVYNLVRHHVNSDAQALIIAGLFPAAWIVFGFIRTRQIDFIGGVVLFGFVIGVGTSTLMGGNAYVLKARDSAFTAVFGLVCIASVLARRKPAIFFVGRSLAAGNDPEKKAAYNELLELPTGRQTFRVLTLVWGFGLLIEAGIRLALAAILNTGVFLAVSPVISAVCIGSMFAYTIIYERRQRAVATSLLTEGEATEAIPLS
jgi:intracellular septation protein A